MEAQGRGDDGEANLDEGIEAVQAKGGEESADRKPVQAPGAEEAATEAAAPLEDASPPGAENHLAKVGDLEADSDGNVTLDALSAAMQRENHSVTEDEVLKRFAELDADGDGLVSKQEIVAAADQGAVVGRKVRKWFDDPSHDPEDGDENSKESGQEYDGEITEIWVAEDGKKFWRVKFEEVSLSLSVRMR